VGSAERELHAVAAESFVDVEPPIGPRRLDADIEPTDEPPDEHPLDGHVEPPDEHPLDGHVEPPDERALDADVGASRAIERDA
jgi:hypothetical protein